jgi:NitT/TauT family transport system substrate-binding protein
MLKSIILNKFTLAAVASLMLFSFTACNKNTDEEVDESKTVHYGETIKNGDIELSYGDEDDTVNDTPSEDEQIEIKLGVLDGASNISFISLMDRNAAGLTNEKYKTETSSDPEKLAEMLKNGELDAATLPPDVAARLYNETDGGIKVVTISVLSNVYVVQNGSEVSDFEDLSGKTIYASKESTLSSYALEAILKNKSVSDYKIEYKDTEEELLKAVEDGSVDFALLSEPDVSKAKVVNTNLDSSLYLGDEWSTLSGSNLVTSVVVVTNDFISNHLSAVKYLIGDCQSTVNLTNHKMDEVAALAVQNGVFDDEKTAKSAIRLCGISYYDGAKMKNMLSSTINTLVQYNTASVGNKIPDTGFYYSEGE